MKYLMMEIEIMILGIIGSCCSIKIFNKFMEISSLPSINSEIKLNFSWSKKSITSEVSRTAEVTANPPNPARYSKETKKCNISNK